MFYKVQSTTLSSQTLDVVWVERIQIYQVLAPGLYRQKLKKFGVVYVIQFELLLCVEDDQDPAIAVVERLQQRYPSVECRLYIGGKQGVINPMVYNMAPAYDDANCDIVWISTSRIKGPHSRHQYELIALHVLQDFWLGTRKGALTVKNTASAISKGFLQELC